jgi:hypothetical protein
MKICPIYERSKDFEALFTEYPLYSQEHESDPLVIVPYISNCLPHLSKNIYPFLLKYPIMRNYTIFITSFEYMDIWTVLTLDLK